MSELIKRYWIALVSAVFLVAAICVYGSNQRAMIAQLEAKQAEISSMKARLVQLDYDRTNVTQIWQQNLNGLDMKLDADYRDKIEAFMKLCTTWSSYKEYMAARDKIMADYDLAEDSLFMKSFMPEKRNVHTDGKDINVIDTHGLNMRYKGNPETDFYVTGISDAGYEYFCIVRMETRTKNTKGTSTGTSISRAILTCTVTPDGAIINPEAFPLWINSAGKPQTPAAAE